MKIRLLSHIEHLGNTHQRGAEVHIEGERLADLLARGLAVPSSSTPEDVAEQSASGPTEPQRRDSIAADAVESPSNALVMEDVNSAPLAGSGADESTRIAAGEPASPDAADTTQRGAEDLAEASSAKEEPRTTGSTTRAVVASTSSVSRRSRKN